MPKISEERKAERREQILGGARRCFAEHGYEGATVARLEDEIGLSRGAIFNYFPSKEDLFVELAVATARACRRSGSTTGSRRSCGRSSSSTPPGSPSISSSSAACATTRTSAPGSKPGRRRSRRPTAPAIEEAQRAGEFRDDIEPKEIGTFVNLVLNGLALMRAGGEELPSTDLVLALLRDAIGPDRARTPARTPA